MTLPNKLFTVSNTGGIKLNLGCGNRKLPGYVNIDIDHKLSPDMVADVRNLDRIDDGSAEEIIAIHLFEHFFYWEIPAILKGWHTKLKDGGKLIIECPDIIYASEQLIEWATKTAETGMPNPQHTMWVFYGDPQSKSPFNCHNWGYWPQQVIDILTASGFKNCVEEKALFKLGPPRDFRVVGEK